MSQHSPFGPSSIERRELCPGSYRMEKDLPDEQSDAALLGSELHKVVAGAIADSVDPSLDAEHAAAVDSCLAFVNAQRAEHPDAEVLVEHRLDLSGLHPKIGFGTADLIMVEPFEWALIVDFKFGHNPPPPAKENRQLAMEAWAVATGFECPRVDVALVLGFLDSSSTHPYVADDFHTIKQHFRRVVERALCPWAPLVVSPQACNYCRASLQCPALLSLACELPLDRVPDKVPPSELGKLLDYVDQIKPWIRGVERRAYQIAFAGGTVPGWVRAFGRGSRGWRAEVTEKKLLDLAEKFGKPPEAVVEKSLASPAAIEKVWGKAKAIRDALEGLIQKKTGKVKLVKAKEEADA